MVTLLERLTVRRLPTYLRSQRRQHTDRRRYPRGHSAPSARAPCQTIRRRPTRHFPASIDRFACNSIKTPPFSLEPAQCPRCRADGLPEQFGSTDGLRDHNGDLSYGSAGLAFAMGLREGVE